MLQDQDSIQALKKRKRRKKSGFSFVEIMVVIIIMGLLVTIVGINLFPVVDGAKIETTKTNIGNLSTALDMYRLHSSKYPSTEQGLKALVSKPEVGQIPQNWNGPYVQGKLPQDGWSTDFKYESDGRSYQIISLGADGVEGGSDGDADLNSKDL